MSAVGAEPAVQARGEERRALGVASGAHALHDGYTDLIYVMLPIWQAEFGLSYAAIGVLRGVFAGTMAGFQIPAGRLSVVWLSGPSILPGAPICRMNWPVLENSST